MNVIDEYILKQDEALRPRLNTIRDAILSAIPDAVEKISYQMPPTGKAGTSSILRLSRIILDYTRAGKHRLYLQTG